MKRIFLSALFLIMTIAVFAQPSFDLGLKGGINVSKMSLELDDYNSESILKAHLGAFGRIGFNRLYVQPEVYFSKKGGEIDSNPLYMATSFNYDNVDVPLLLGLEIIKGNAFNLRLMGGPVFSFVTKSAVDGDSEFDPDYFKDNYIGIQYGLGVDVLMFTIDARMEHANDLYEHPSFSGNGTTFMVTAGIKIF